MKMLDGMVALVTGATGGIGLAIAQMLAQHGAKIAFNGKGDDNVVNNAISLIKGKNNSGNNSCECMYYNADCASPDAIKDMINRVVMHFGSIDILVNNAGIQHVDLIQDFPENKIEELMRVNLLSAIYATKYTIPHMYEKKIGRIVNIASVHGLVASPCKSIYVASKHGLIGFTKSVALEAGAHGVTVNAICPGYVKTSLVEKQIDALSSKLSKPKEDVINNYFLSQHVLKQFVEVGDIANMVLFLCGPHGSKINGAELKIDCGWSAH